MISTFVATKISGPNMTIISCEFRIGDVHMLHASDPGYKSRTALRGSVVKRSAEGRVEASSSD